MIAGGARAHFSAGVRICTIVSVFVLSASARAMAQSSPDGTQTPPASAIIDSAGSRWTISGTYACKDGVCPEAGGYSERLLYAGGEIYTYWVGQWWRYLGHGWTSVGATSPASGTTATPSANGLQVKWDPSPAADVSGYVVYVGSQPGTPNSKFDVGNTTSYGFTNAAPGQAYYFSVAAYASGGLVGPPSAEVMGVSNLPPSLQNPGNQSTVVGQAVALRLTATDPNNDVMIYTAAGLPPGLSVALTTGAISGTPTTAGTYKVVATASDGLAQSSQAFTWTTTSATVPTPAPTTPAPPANPSPTVPVVVITSPTTASQFTADTKYVTVGGTVTDDLEVTEVTWWTDRGFWGHTTGTNSWIAGIPLKNGDNVITVQARDKAGRTGRSTLSVRKRK